MSPLPSVYLTVGLKGTDVQKSVIHKMIKKVVTGRRLIQVGPCLLSLLLMSDAGAKKTYTIAKRPSWVRPIELPKYSSNLDSGGVHYLLLDRQVSGVGKKIERYVHSARRFVNEGGLENRSKIQIGFDPSYQRLVLHEIVLHRGGNIINRLYPKNIKTVQREREIEQNIYSGAITVLIMPEDVRIGDVLEYSFTLVGSNPALLGRYSESYSLQWSTPLETMHLRHLWPNDNPLKIRVHGRELKAAKSEVVGATEYVWRLDGVTAYESEKSIPIWHEPRPWLEVTNTANWQDVARWGAKSYGAVALNKTLIELAEKLAEKHTDPKKITAEVLHYVQREIRYLGIELGAGSYKPRHPNNVFKKRFGDCKDKTLLLVSLLRHLGIEAHPALVSGSYAKSVADVLPSVTAFDHVITLVRIENEEYWLDPTRLYQLGKLEEHYLPDYGYALVLQEDTSELSKISLRPEARFFKEINSTYDLTKDPVTLQVETIHQGEAAEDFRGFLAEATKIEMQKDYEAFYQKTYPKARMSHDIVVDPYKQSNKVSVKERYNLPGFWQENSAGYPYVEFTALEIEGYLRDVSVADRRSPIARQHPIEMIENTKILMDQDYGLSSERYRFETESFEFQYRVVAEANGLMVNLYHRYATKLDHVRVNERHAHNTGAEKGRELASYYIIPWPEGKGVNLFMVVIVLMIAMVTVVGMRRLYAWDPVPRADPTKFEDKYKKIGGLLYLPAFGILLFPLMILTDLDYYTTTLYKSQWDAAMSPDSPHYFPAWGISCAAGLLIMVVQVLFYFTLVPLFFKRRSSFPAIYMAGLTVSLLLEVLQVMGNRASGVESEYSDLTRGVSHTIIWVVYFATSVRAKQTFVRRLHPSTDRPGEQPATCDEVESKIEQAK